MRALAIIMKGILTILTVIFSFVHVSGQVEDTIFPNAKNKIVFQCPQSYLFFEDDENDSLDITPRLYFYIDRKGININKLKYFKFYLGYDTIDNYIGYLRQDGNKIYVIPINQALEIGNEKLFLDFDARPGKSWKTYSIGPIENDKIKVIKRYFDADLGEFLTEFKISGSNTHTIIEHLTIGRKSGFIKVTFLTHYGTYIECNN